MSPIREDRQAAREARLDELHEKLTGAVEQLVSGEDWARALAFAAQFRSRSFNNTLLIWAQHAAAFERGLVPEPVPSYVAGYKQWQGLGRQVLRGQPGYQIIAPVTGRFASAHPQDADSWRRLGKFEKPRAGEVVRSKMVGVRPAYVWDASQTEGDPIPSPPAPRLLAGEAPQGLWEGLAAQVQAAGFTLVDVPSAGEICGANGMTSYDAKTVHRPGNTGDSEATERTFLSCRTNVSTLSSYGSARLAWCSTLSSPIPIRNAVCTAASVTSSV